MFLGVSIFFQISINFDKLRRLYQKLKSSTKEVLGFTAEALENLERYKWPGNVRELENVVERAVALVRGDLITKNELPLPVQSGKSSSFSFSDICFFPYFKL